MHILDLASLGVLSVYYPANLKAIITIFTTLAMLVTTPHFVVSGILYLAQTLRIKNQIILVET
jgi:uncharacterized membrane protein YkgB